MCFTGTKPPTQQTLRRRLMFFLPLPVLLLLLLPPSSSSLDLCDRRHPPVQQHVALLPPSEHFCFHFSFRSDP